MESRTIVREYAPDALPVHGHAHGGGVHREVSAFGMTTHVQRAGRQLGNIVYICGSLLLGGNGTQEGHVEVFLPAHNGGISPAKRDIGRTVGKPKRHGGELLLAHVVRPEPQDGQAARPKPRARAYGE